MASSKPLGGLDKLSMSLDDVIKLEKDKRISNNQGESKYKKPFFKRNEREKRFNNKPYHDKAYHDKSYHDKLLVDKAFKPQRRVSSLLLFIISQLIFVYICIEYTMG